MCRGAGGREEIKATALSSLTLLPHPHLSFSPRLSLSCQIMESASLKPGCLVIGADREKLVMLEENNK